MSCSFIPVYVVFVFFFNVHASTGIYTYLPPLPLPDAFPIVFPHPSLRPAPVSAPGLIFIAAATDDLIRAIDNETGETVWQDTLPAGGQANRSEEDTSELQSLMRISYPVFCLKQKKL